MARHPLLQLRDVSKSFGSLTALDSVSMAIYPGEVLCLLGDNGAGKSTLIKIISGVFAPDAGTVVWGEDAVVFEHPRDAMDRGIGTVYQDLAMLPLMSVARNFFLGHEPLTRMGPIKVFDRKLASEVARAEVRKLGIELRNPDQIVGTLSGGERQSIAAAKAVYFGAKLLIMDEPTSALGVKEARLVLRNVRQAADQGVAVILITHNVHHAFAVGDRFFILQRGRMTHQFQAGDRPLNDVQEMMAGETLEELRNKIRNPADPS
jgi:simple sugar transport system ATP-binding protein